MNVMTIKHKDGLAFDVRVRRRKVAADMPPEEGGEGKGFTPAELLAGALGACVAIQVQNYCNAHGCEHGDVSVSLVFEFIGKPRRIGAIVVDVDVPEDFPEEGETEVRRVAEEAVICETLRHPPEVDLEIQFNRKRRPELTSVQAGTA